MSQNLVIPNKDNKVVLTFGGVDLTLATNILITFGAETYNLVDDPTVVIVDSETQLSLDLSSTNEVGKVFVTVTYVDGGSVNGTDITSQELDNLSQIVVAIGTQLIIEDGSQVDNANSFVTDAEYKTYANLRGLTVAATQPDREADLIAAMDYLQSVEHKMKGYRASSTQALLYPRYGVLLHGYVIANTVIPNELKRAQMEAAVYSTSSELLTNTTNENIKKEKVDVLETEYFTGGNVVTVDFQRVDAQLKPLLKATDTMVRV